jgi:hypothetical protein
MFGFLQWNYYLIHVPISSISPLVFKQFFLFIYYTCWVGGVTIDLDLRERTYLANSTKSVLALKEIVLVPIFVGIAALIIWCSDDDKLFTYFLNAFFIANILGFFT